ncbi:MAG: aminotransferase class III-fold pyridoxal phosphate-dependent enzyme [Spirochaetaceae bacterium]|nr:aminotransferase class III-fold pyridoxal phosphate-dependent enzyme [Spirochaetaceae bacterium]
MNVPTRSGLTADRSSIADRSLIAEHFHRASQVLPGGVNSSTRVNKALGTPMYVAHADGSRITDIEGRTFIDLCCGHGAALLGHGHPAIADALATAARIGFPSIYETPYHEELARLVCDAVPSADRVRFCSSGSEATLHLIRACRAHTGRDKIIRIEGHFHGYHELIYIGGHPPADQLARNRTEPYLESPGIPREFARLVVPIPHNDVDALEQAVERHGEETAALMLEPVNWNWGAIRPEPAYLRRMRELTAEAGIVLFFDEIQSAFKTRHLTAQAEYGVIPDVTTIGKSLGGGLPVSAFSGIAGIMDLFQPVGRVQHSGTFNAHPVPILASLAFVRETGKPYFYETLEALEDRFDRGLKRIIAGHGLNMIAPVSGGRFAVIFGRTTPPSRYEDCLCHDNRVMLRFIKGCYDRGVYLHDYGGGPLHHGFSVQHTMEDLDEALNVMEDALVEMKRDGAVPTV